jgi:Na+/H+ antiporter NhaD/arsenite permease-like protein
MQTAFLDHLTHPLALFSLVIFLVAYGFVITEEFTQLRKSKPVVLAAGLIWVCIGLLGRQLGLLPLVEQAFQHNILEYAQLFLFLLVAMSYINALEDRGLFHHLQIWLTNHQFTYRQLFWITGILAFFISAIADNLTTALLMCSVILAVEKNNQRFISLSCINLVVAANAGGAFCPFGDITTLMVWQMDKLAFFDFFKLFIPSVVNFLIPAFCIHFAIPDGKPLQGSSDSTLQPGAFAIFVLFILTIIITVLCRQFLNLPAAFGMMFGFGLLKVYAFSLNKRSFPIAGQLDLTERSAFNIFHSIQRIEWDTMLFFYGVMLCVGGLATLGYLAFVSDFLYVTLGQHLASAWSATPANVLIGVLSAIVDNIPIMYAVLTMDPLMSEGQWLLITLTAGVGGSLLAVGSAAGVALLGQSRGQYTFMSHLKWTWAIALGYIGAIAMHLWLNQQLF